MFLFAGSM